METSKLISTTQAAAGTHEIRVTKDTFSWPGRPDYTRYNAHVYINGQRTVYMQQFRSGRKASQWATGHVDAIPADTLAALHRSLAT